ncbi:MAG: integration host factor subunit beta [Alcaligenaceae bacterium]|nr:integration host factor subunit beta [Alcaligenaceae bacterium]
MTKSELIEALAADFSQLPARDIDYAVNTILDAMVDALAEGKRIEVRGFGSFSLSQRAPRVGRNPKSGERVMVPGKKVPHFKAGKELRERVDAAFQDGSSSDVKDVSGANQDDRQLEAIG